MKRLPHGIKIFHDTHYLAIKKQWKAPFDYQAKAAGKKVRIEMTLALAELYQLRGAMVTLVADVGEYFNAACLIHDDIADEDEVRRGAPAVWVKYGLATALISGMYGYIEGLKLLARSGNLEVVRIGLESLEQMHVGQALDVQLNAGSRLPTLQEYRLTSETNTGCLFLLILNIFQVLKPAPNDMYLALRSTLLSLSVHYRFVNDYCDINHIPLFEKKGFAPDLDSGPKSYVMMVAGEVLDKRKRTTEEKRAIIHAYGQSGVFDEVIVHIDRAFKEVMDGFSEVEKSLKQHNHAGHAFGGNLTRLKALLQKLEFKQDVKDNFYLSMQNEAG